MPAASARSRASGSTWAKQASDRRRGRWQRRHDGRWVELPGGEVDDERVGSNEPLPRGLHAGDERHLVPGAGERRLDARAEHQVRHERDDAGHYWA